MLVFVYGTLRQGQPNHRLLDGARFVGTAETVPFFRMVSLGAYPGMVRDRSQSRKSIVGEIYDVDEDTLGKLDQLEGVPHFYFRSRVRLTDGGFADAYLLRRDQVVGFNEVVSGDWCDRSGFGGFRWSDEDDPADGRD